MFLLQQESFFIILDFGQVTKRLKYTDRSINFKRKRKKKKYMKKRKIYSKNNKFVLNKNHRNKFLMKNSRRNKKQMNDSFLYNFSIMKRWLRYGIVGNFVTYGIGFGFIAYLGTIVLTKDGSFGTLVKIKV